MHEHDKTFAQSRTHTRKSLKEHILLQIWVDRENGKKINGADVLVKRETIPDDLLRETVEDGDLVVQNGLVLLSQQGEKFAENIVRRHRLAEVLFSEILEVDEETARSKACDLEHVITEEVTDSICTFLGHPLHCPHGMAIPRGKCCATFKRDLGPLIKPVIDLKIGESGRISFMSPKTHFRLDRLMTFGITPGTIVRLQQKKPSIVLQVGETDLALDYDIAKNIYVKQVNGEK